MAGRRAWATFLGPNRTPNGWGRHAAHLSRAGVFSPRKRPPPPWPRRAAPHGRPAPGGGGRGGPPPAGARLPPAPGRGVVHTLSLAEALQACGVHVRVIALGDPGAGFFREVRAPYHVVPAPPGADTLEERVVNAVDALERGLAAIADEVDIMHTQDCIA